MKEQEQPHHEEPFWTIDEELGELELLERPSGPALYTVRLKARQESAPYHPKRELYPLAHKGTRQEVWGKAYILVPDITLTVGLYKNLPPSGAIGQVTNSTWHGMRHHDIANVRGLYYQEDQVLAIWEVDAWSRLDELTHGRLWQLFESFLLSRYPEASRIYTDDAEPGEDPSDNREMLSSLGYTPLTGTQRIFAKEVARQ